MAPSWSHYLGSQVGMLPVIGSKLCVDLSYMKFIHFSQETCDCLCRFGQTNRDMKDQIKGMYDIEFITFHFEM